MEKLWMLKLCGDDTHRALYILYHIAWVEPAALMQPKERRSGAVGLQQVSERKNNITMIINMSYSFAARWFNHMVTCMKRVVTSAFGNFQRHVHLYKLVCSLYTTDEDQTTACCNPKNQSKAILTKQSEESDKYIKS